MAAVVSKVCKRLHRTRLRQSIETRCAQVTLFVVSGRKVVDLEISDGFSITYQQAFMMLSTSILRLSHNDLYVL